MPTYAMIDGVSRELTSWPAMVDGVSRELDSMAAAVDGVQREIFSAVKLLGLLPEGSIIQLNEGGSPADFYVAKQDYESGLNGAGRTLLVRKDCYDTRQWYGTFNKNTYASSSINKWLNGDYKSLLDADVQEAIGTTMLYFTYGNGNTSVGTLERSIFLLSATELGGTSEYFNVEGTALPIAGILQTAFLNGSAETQWTRTPRLTGGDNQFVYYFNANGKCTNGYCYGTEGSRPAFTLPATFII